MKNKQLLLPKILLLFGLFFLIPNHVEGQFLKKLKEKAEKKIEREAEKRAERRVNKKIDKQFDKAEDVLDGKTNNGTKEAKTVNGNATTKSSSQETSQNFGDFTSLYPANGDVTVVPIHCNWEIPNMENYKFTVHIEGDDWDDWLTKNTDSDQVFIDNLPTSTKNLKWQVIAEGNGQRIESPWQSFTTTDGTDNSTSQPAKPNVVWSKFDFIPGDEVIFEDSPSADEENGEFPSRWDLVSGQVEIANVDSETVMMFLDGGEIVPYLKNSSKDYLPEVFTIEFDFYKPAGGNRLTFYLTDQKNQRGKQVYDNAQEFDVTPVRVDAPEGGAVIHSERDSDYCENGCWTHVSIAYTKGKLKVYLDDTRLVNIPHYSFNPTGFTMYPYFASAKDNKAFYVKNVRIAQGGVKYYDRMLSDGKIVINGIKFDVNKATLKAESMGPINEIYDLMNKNPEINFSVEGHTDSDGGDDTNMILSKARGKSVMDKLIEMGISANRLKSDGFGESKPIDNNSSPEGKANNRRVEFVKF